MRPDDAPDGLSDGAYIAQQSWRGNLPILMALGAVDAFLLYQAIRNPGPGIVFALAGFCAVTAVVAVLVTRSVRRGEVSFAVDARGVYFGPTGESELAELIPWSWIDCIVTFDRIVHGANQKGRRHCVGVELNAAGVTERMARLPRPPGLPPPTALEREFNEAALMPWFSRLIAEPSLVERQIQGWRLDTARLAQAVTRHAPETPIARRPTRPAPSIASIAATAWEVRKNLQRLAERDDHKNDDQ
ncbi:hypothetical protein [Actinomadura sp. 6K520]|jgi:hypothetical protein|uniref:hypothetical protein n=1 Tax=Actinomadura sp. 6K520 TaxID=2530364 RepID=UPI00105279F1|nr:hypothetical protein [Actinomadura sp. 6K520]TDE34049.1 hypothetical protein E1289_10540 [Actinomadura sp. 6K520]